MFFLFCFVNMLNCTDWYLNVKPTLHSWDKVHLIIVYELFQKIFDELLLFSHPVVSDSLWPHGLQHTRPLCPSPSPKVCPGLFPLHQWCHPAISSSDALFFFCPQSFPASGTFLMSQLFASDDQNIGVSTSASVLPMSIQGWFPLRLTDLISLLSNGLSRVFSSSWKASIPQCFFTVQLSQYMTTGKTIALAIWTFVGRVMSAIQHTVEVCHRFPAKKQTSSHFMAAVTIHSDFRAEEEEICHSYHLSPLYLPWSNGTGCYHLSFFNIQF